MEGVSVFDHTLRIQDRGRDRKPFCPEKSEFFRKKIISSADSGFLRRKDLDDISAAAKYRVGARRAAADSRKGKSVPSENLPYERCKGVRILVDAEGEALKGVLPLRPFLVKPNIHELGGLFGRELSGPEEVPFYGKKLQEAGAENVLVSMAGQGAVFLSAEGHVYRSPAPKGELINGVGAGDSMVAGFLAGWLESGNYETAFSMGLAAGSASAFSEGLAEKKEVQRLLQEIRPRRLE